VADARCYDTRTNSLGASIDEVDDYVREAVQAKIQKDIEDRVYEKIKGELRAWKFLGVSGSIVGGFLLAVIIAFHEPLFALRLIPLSQVAQYVV
jgi:hypothetical protein